MKNENIEANNLVSVIVPAYNVENYIEKCLKSILSQTYKNIEIIVVDDGSTDSTSSIIDALAQENTLIQVFHQKNAGVSAARNYGLDIASGDYIMFIDGDDFIAPDCVEYLMQLVFTTDADFCLSKNCFMRKNEEQVSKDEIKVLSPAEGATLLLAPIIKVGCWNKIFKKSLIDNNDLRFSTSLFYGEGLKFITTAAQLSNSVGVGLRKVYYYRSNNATSATTKFNIEKILNGEKSIDLIEQELKYDDKRLKVMLNYHRTLFYLAAIIRLKSEKLVKIYKAEYKRWKAYVRRNCMSFLFVKGLSVYRKVLIIFGWMFPRLIAKLDQKRRRHNFANSID